jgi:predicted transcriptional regulator
VLVWYTIVWYTVNMVKKQTCIRMSDTAKELVVLLAERLGISQSAVLELAIRTLAKREGIQEKGVK